MVIHRTAFRARANVILKSALNSAILNHAFRFWAFNEYWVPFFASSDSDEYHGCCPCPIFLNWVPLNQRHIRYHLAQQNSFYESGPSRPTSIPEKGAHSIIRSNGRSENG